MVLIGYFVVYSLTKAATTANSINCNQFYIQLVSKKRSPIVAFPTKIHYDHNSFSHRTPLAATPTSPLDGINIEKSTINF